MMNRNGCRVFFLAILFCCVNLAVMPVQAYPGEFCQPAPWLSQAYARGLSQSVTCLPQQFAAAVCQPAPALKSTQAGTQGQIEEAKKKQEEARKRQEEAKKQEAEAEKSREEILASTDELTKQLTQLLAEQELLKQDVETEKEKLAQAKKERDEAEQKEKEQHQAMKERIRFLYENSREGYLDVLLGARTASSFFNRKEYVQSLYRYDRKKLEEYQSTKNLAKQKQEESLQREAELETMKEEQRTQQESLEGMIRENRQKAGQFTKQLERARAEADAYVKLVEEQNQEIQRLEQILRASVENSSGQSANGVQGGQNRNTVGPDGPASGPSTGMTKSVGGTERGRRIADYGLSFLGNPYVWGGTSLTNGADCSGFVQSVYRHFGITLPRTSAEQRTVGVEVPFSEAEPGDLVCYAGHIGIYIGNGQIVHASNAKNGIITSYATYRTILCVRRVI